MKRHRVGIISEPFKSNPHLLARSRAKAAIRVLSSITILRGATFYMSPYKTVMMVERYVPEAVTIARRAIAIVDGATSEPTEAMDLTEQTIELFYSLYPDSRSK